MIKNNNKYGGSPQQNPNQTAMHTKQKEDDRENKCPLTVGSSYRPSASISNGGTRFFEEYSLAYEDNKNQGLTICISTLSAPFIKQHIKRVLPRMYHNEILPHIKKLTGLEPKNRVILFLSSLLWSEQKYLGVAYENTILTHVIFDKIDYYSTLVHEMVHVLFNQHDKIISRSANEGIATYIQCEFAVNIPCYPDYFIRINTVKKEIESFFKQGRMTIFYIINTWIHEEEHPYFQSAYFYMEQLIRYLLNKIVLKKKMKDRYAPLKEMIKSNNIDIWIHNTAIPHYLNSNSVSFLEGFEEFLLSLPDK